jgi:hypothetical protein
MTRERWAEIDRVWHAVLARPESERAAALDELCAGDAELRAEVEALLANLAQASAAGFGALPGVAVTHGALVGRQLGPYAVSALLCRWGERGDVVKPIFRKRRQSLLSTLRFVRCRSRVFEPTMPRP